MVAEVGIILKRVLRDTERLTGQDSAASVNGMRDKSAVTSD
jgi:hypothetical protein